MYRYDHHRQSLWYAIGGIRDVICNPQRSPREGARGLCGQIGWPAALGGFLLVGGNPAFINHASSRPHTAFFFFFFPFFLAKGVYTVCVCVRTYRCIVYVPPAEWNSGAPSVQTKRPHNFLYSQEGGEREEEEKGEEEFE